MPTHWKKLTNPNYLGSYAFEQNEEKVGTIDYVKQERVKGTDGKEEDCIVCHFKEASLKPFILNKENCKTITKLYNTPYIENWAGKKITMFVKMVSAFGDMVEAVRIRSKVPSAKTPDIKCEECGKVIKGMGQYGPDFVAKKNKERYGRCLCIDCGNKAKAEMEAKKDEPAPTPEEPENNLAAELLADAQ